MILVSVAVALFTTKFVAAGRVSEDVGENYVSSANRDAFDCPMRQLLLEYAVEIQPDITSDQLQEIADALNGTPEKASNCTVTPTKSMKSRLQRHAPSWEDLKDIKNHNNNHGHGNEYVLFVSSKNGDDSNTGSFESPLKSLEIAIKKAKNIDSNIIKKIILRGGKYHVQNTITFTSKDKNFLISNYNNEFVKISAATPIDCNWQLYKNGTNGKNIYSCDLSSSSNPSISSIKGLRVNGMRGIRARYPNNNPETGGFGSTLKALSWDAQTFPSEPDEVMYPDYPFRNTSSYNWFQRYTLGIGGVCEHFSPPAGYWCSTHTQGGGAFTYKNPSGMRFNSSILPHSPYASLMSGSSSGSSSSSSNEGGMIKSNELTENKPILQVWRPGHWSSWMFEVGTYDYSNLKSEDFIFSKGGFQGARGNSNGEDFYIENVFEELDYPTEWFFNESTKVLYYYSNDTKGIPNDMEFEVTNLKVIISYNGNLTNPVCNHMVRGLQFQDTKYTYLDPHGMPSGGDWALQRTGAIYINGACNITITNNNFTRLDGNAVSINRYARNISLTYNEFVWIGDSAITQWGDTDGVTFPSYDFNDTDTMTGTTSMGFDGTNGNQPRGSYIAYNFVHELGIWEKQSSFYFQAKSCQNLIEHNIFFNGPRAGINFNDGFGGGSKILHNILFNTCRESSDHGNFNSWDRQVYLTDVTSDTTATISTIKKYDEIGWNFMIANYDVQEAVDNDDGSCYYKTHDNLMTYSGNGMKNDFGGHDNHHYNNIYAYLTSGSCFNVAEGTNTWQKAGHNDYFYNNTCVFDTRITKLSNYGTFDCSKPMNTWPIMGNNSVYVLNGSDVNVGLCNINEESMQTNNQYDLGTKIYNTYPTSDALIAQARQMLF